MKFILNYTELKQKRFNKFSVLQKFVRKKAHKVMDIFEYDNNNKCLKNLKLEEINP